ncbi:MAG: HK97-gp10 family putative phage morphogenesis protein [Gammaproteobacteria bacterium]
MRSLSVKLQKKALAAAVRKGANLVRDAAKAGAMAIDDPATAESIYKNVGVSFSARESRRQGGIVYRVGIRGGARKGKGGGGPGGDTWYWRLVEFGTSRTQARPFLRPALENNAERATDAIAAELNRQLDKLAAER